MKGQRERERELWVKYLKPGVTTERNWTRKMLAENKNAVPCNLALSEGNEHETIMFLCSSVLWVCGERDQYWAVRKISGLGDRLVAQDINLVNAPPLPYAVKIVVKIILYSEERHIIMYVAVIFRKYHTTYTYLLHQYLIIHLRTKMENKTAKLLSNHIHKKCSSFFAIIISSFGPCNDIIYQL